MKPRFLNGCAKSIPLVEAFEAQGWDAWSCDILPSEGWHKHIQDDVIKHLNDGWDMAIFHPDCTYIANSGVRWYHERQQQELTKRACEFFNKLRNAHIPLIGLENPIPHKYAKEYIGEYDQLIQPWNFGDMESKATCLWLQGLPLLIKEITVKPEGLKQSVWREPPSLDRKANRSRNFYGISRAMAAQWCNLIEGDK